MIATALLLLSTASGALAPEPERLDRLLEQARRVQRADLEAWRRFRFHREVLREKLDADGRVKSAERLEFRITPAEGGFDEALIRLDGEIPPARDVREHRDKARFTERYHEALGGGAGGSNRFSFFRLLYVGEMRYEGRETVGGLPCHRLGLSPPVGPVDGGTAAKIGNALEGTLWLTEDGLHLYRAEARLTEPVWVGGGLARLRDLAIDLEASEVVPGVWLPRLLKVQSMIKVVGFPVRKRNTFRYSDYHVVEPARQADPGRR